MFIYGKMGQVHAAIRRKCAGQPLPYDADIMKQGLQLLTERALYMIQFLQFLEWYEIKYGITLELQSGINDCHNLIVQNLISLYNADTLISSSLPA